MWATLFTKVDIGILAFDLKLLFLDGHATFTPFYIQSFLIGLDTVAGAAFGGYLTFVGLHAATFRVFGLGTFVIYVQPFL